MQTVLECPAEASDAPLCDQFNEWLRTRADDQHSPPPAPTPSPSPTPPTPPNPKGE